MLNKKTWTTRFIKVTLTQLGEEARLFNIQYILKVLSLYRGLLLVQSTPTRRRVMDPGKLMFPAEHINLVNT